MATGGQQEETGMAAVLAAIKEMRDDMTHMKKEMRQEREAADERLVKRIKLDPIPTFKKKGHEKQFRFNSSVEEKLDDISAALQETPPAIEKAKTALEEGKQLITNRQKLIKIADRSEFGWSTVEEYVEDELADNSDDEKRLLRAEGRAKRKYKANEEKKKKQHDRKQFLKRDIRFPRTANSIRDGPNQSHSRNNPIPLANNGTISSPLGPCFQCGKTGHLRRYCPLNSKN